LKKIPLLALPALALSLSLALGCSKDSPSTPDADALLAMIPGADTVGAIAPQDAEELERIDARGSVKDIDSPDTPEPGLDAENPLPNEDADSKDPGDVVPEDIEETKDALEGPDGGFDSRVEPSDGREVDPNDTDAETSETIASTCFPWVSNPEALGPTYEESGATIGSHCLGTNHQEIAEIELVVFLGDSVTVGTPNFEHLLPTDNNHYWRNKIAKDLVSLYGLDKGNDLSWGLWKSWDAFEQKGALNESGDFRNCAHWGGRTKDFLEGDKQLDLCFPDGGSDKKTLVLFTVGGNDFKKIVDTGSGSTPEEVAAGYLNVWAEAEAIINHLKNAIEWLKDPVRFPNGVSIIFANPYEFTDGTGDTSSCASAEVLSGVEAWEDSEALATVSTWIFMQFMDIAVSTQTDMVFMLEGFCGHGYVKAGPTSDPDAYSPCDAGPDAALWFDETCVHPNQDGHQAIYDMFSAVILE
jgi:lysophospholipase L1-like esterase